MAEEKELLTYKGHPLMTGGLKAASGGITAAVLFGVLAALIFRPKDKS